MYSKASIKLCNFLQGFILHLEYSSSLVAIDVRLIWQDGAGLTSWGHANWYVDDFKYEDDLKHEDDLKFEDALIYEDNLK